jgi:hypothetical protein
VGRNHKKAVKSNLVFVLLHLLKHEFQPRRRSRSSLDSMLEHRQRLRDDLAESPSPCGSPRSSVRRCLCPRAIIQTGLSEQAFPQTSPYGLEQALDPDFLPG